jgi:hypothetical protein
MSPVADVVEAPDGSLGGASAESFYTRRRRASAQARHLEDAAAVAQWIKRILGIDVNAGTLVDRLKEPGVLLMLVGRLEGRAIPGSAQHLMGTDVNGRFWIRQQCPTTKRWYWYCAAIDEATWDDPRQPCDCLPSPRVRGSDALSDEDTEGDDGAKTRNDSPRRKQKNIFHVREEIVGVLRELRALGVRETMLFDVDDLIMDKSHERVVACMRTLMDLNAISSLRTIASFRTSGSVESGNRGSDKARDEEEKDAETKKDDMAGTSPVRVVGDDGVGLGLEGDCAGCDTARRAVKMLERKCEMLGAAAARERAAELEARAEAVERRVAEALRDRKLEKRDSAGLGELVCPWPISTWSQKIARAHPRLWLALWCLWHLVMLWGWSKALACGTTSWPLLT